MKVTGYMLREAIKRWRHRRDTLFHQFPETLWAFEGDDKPAPADVMAKFLDADRAVARLEAAQEKYNQMALVEQTGGTTTITLAEAVKQVGGWGRAEKLWRGAVLDREQDRYASHAGERMRDKDNVFAKRQIPAEQCLVNADAASRAAAELRALIAVANTSQIEVNVPSALLA